MRNIEVTMSLGREEKTKIFTISDEEEEQLKALDIDINDYIQDRAFELAYDEVEVNYKELK